MTQIILQVMNFYNEDFHNKNNKNDNTVFLEKRNLSLKSDTLF